MPFSERLREFWSDWWGLIVLILLVVGLAALLLAIVRNSPPSVTEDMAIRRYIEMRDICLTYEQVSHEECEAIALDWMLAYGDASWYKYR